jgi:hypothetical protein
MAGKAILALLAPSGSSKKDDSGGGDDEQADKGDAGYEAIMSSTAKDILDADNPKDLKAALYEFVCAAMKQESGEGE